MTDLIYRQCLLGFHPGQHQGGLDLNIRTREGGQLPIGWDRGPKATIDNLFSTSWKLYEDINTGNGMTMHSLFPDTQFSGSFAGDLKEWFQALVELRRYSEEAYVNIGNAG